ncbi:hypothetical protein, partial [Mycoplasmopsis bovis]|uniref:hypothetical protein n=1 Tax=Mycoplasmopsis bovis TaxID=28903 RepID=UPI003D286386
AIYLMAILELLSISIGESKSKINAFFNKKEIQLNNADLSNLALCYACTVHKTQGSEFQKVILVLDPEISGSFINKRLFAGNNN